MKIKNIKINGFGKLENKEFEFSEGINIINGKNEAGKSTLLKFITCMLYGASKNKNGKFISDYEKYRPWSNNEFSGKISYELDNGESYEVFREFKKKTPVIYNSTKDDISSQYQVDKNKESTYFQDQTGITEEDFFSTSASEQGNTRLSDTMKNSVIQKLSNIVTTGNENISYKKAIDKINKNQLETVGSQRSSGRPLNIIEEEIEKLEEEKENLEEYKDKKYEVEGEKQTLKVNLKDIEVVLDLLRKQKVNLEKSRLKQEKLRVYREVLEDNRSRKDRIEEKLENLKEERQESLRKNNAKYYLYAAIIILITGFSIFLKKYIFLFLNIIPVILILAQAISNHKKRVKLKNSGKRVHQERMQLEEEIEEIEEEYNKKEREIARQENEILQEQKYQEERLKEEYDKRLDEETIKDILSTKYEKIVEFIDEKEREKTECKINEKRIEVDNENIIKNLENLVELDERLENLYEKKDELLQLNNMYEIVKEELENSYQEMKENITPDFLEELKNIMIQVTKGKYANLYLDSENNILIEIKNGSYVPIELLSVGTIDLIYLALRISAAKEISKENMPLILDESLAYYDDQRMERILNYLSEIDNHQILIFSCSERENAILEKNNIQYNKIEL